jgi:WD40 repeat protein
MLLPLAIGGGVAVVVLALGGILFFAFGRNDSSPEIAAAPDPPAAASTPVAVPAVQPAGIPANPSSAGSASATSAASSSPPPSSSPSSNSTAEPVSTATPTPAATPLTTAPAATPGPMVPVAPSVGANGKPIVPLRVRLNVSSGNRPNAGQESEVDDESWEKLGSLAKEDSEALASWTAKADPPPSALEYKKGKITTNFPKDARYELELPEGPGNYVFANASARGNHAYLPVDLRTGKTVGKPVVTDIHAWNPKFSPDGRYVAFPPFGNRGGIRVYSFATGEQIQEITENEGDWIKKITFAGTHKLLVAVWGSNWKHRLHLWDLKTGELSLEVQFPDDWKNRLVEETVTASPGGKYAACVLGNKVSIIDLETGQAAGQVSIGDRMVSARGVGFSSDGERLALFGHFSGSGDRLIVVEMNQGVVQTNVRTNIHFGFGNDGPTVQFTPDNEMILYKSEALLDTKSGRPVWKFDNRWHETIKMLRMSDVLVMVKDGKQPGLQTVSAPGSQIAKALEHVRRGGSGSDINLPPLTEAKLAAGSQKTLRDQRESWTYQATPAIAGYSGDAKSTLVAAAGDNIRGARFAGPGLGQVILHRESRTSVDGRPESKYQVERLDLETGVKTSALPIPEPYALCDASPSGNLAAIALTETDRKVTRVDVVALSPKKHLLGIRPYTEDASKADTRMKLRSQENDGEARTIALLNDERLLTLNPKGKLVVWEVATGNAVYYYEKFGRLLAFSPNREHFVAAHKGHFRMFKSDTGDVVGSLETPYSGAFCRGAAFRADGGELCAVMDAGNDKIVVRWNLSTGQVEQEFPISGDAFRGSGNEQASERNLVYRGNDHVLIANEYLLDLTKRAIVWRYAGISDNVVMGNSDARSWHCLARGGDEEGAVTLVSRDMPSQRVAASAATVQLDDQLLLFPGGAVKLDIDLSGVGLQTHHAAAQKAIEESLEQRGIGVQPSGVPMTLRAGEQATGAKLGVSKSTNPFGAPALPRFNQTPDQVIDQKVLHSHFTILDSSGRPAWTQTISVPMRSWGSIKEGNAQAILRQEMYDSFTSMLSAKRVSLGIPTFIFKPLTQIVAGESEFYAGGERDPKVREKPQEAAPAGQPNQPFSSNPFGAAATP